MALRRSPRLVANGYYDLSGLRTVFYKERLFRVFKSRKRRRQRPLQKDVNNNNEDMGESDWDDWMDDSDLDQHVRARWELRSLFLLSLALLVILFGLLFTPASKFRNLSDDSAFLSLPSAPSAIFHDSQKMLEQLLLMQRRMSEMERELQMLKQHVDLVHQPTDLLENYALESLGADIVLCRSSSTYLGPPTHWYLLFFPKYRPARSPRTILQGKAELVPGQCWPFVGSAGRLLISLPYPVHVHHVALGHITKQESVNHTILSAPKEFSVNGFMNLNEIGTHLGTFTYHDEGKSVQVFKIPDHQDKVFKFVELKIHSNWGHPDYTCLYSVRVHGRLEVPGLHSPE
ncbi:SUN domain-containing protein 5-like isoform 1-T2 [Synchiropus picturatus]